MSKKKLVSLCLVLALLLTAAIGGTMAYFTDTDSATNTFTSGNVAIDLTEADVVEDEDGNLVANGDIRNDVDSNEEDAYDYGKLYPGQSVYKDPTIKNKGSENAYVAAVVTITDGEGDIHEMIGVEGYDNIDITKLIAQDKNGGSLAGQATAQATDYNGLSMVYKNDNYAIYQVADRAKGTYIMYFFVEAEMKEGDTVTLFNDITIPAGWTNEDMANFKELTIKVDAYAVQAHGFDTCFEAMTTAFPEVFSF